MHVFRFLVMFYCVFVFLNISYFSLIFNDILKYFVSRGVFSPLVAKQWQGNTQEWKKSSQRIKVSFKIPLVDYFPRFFIYLLAN
jgi:hypothetical protein